MSAIQAVAHGLRTGPAGRRSVTSPMVVALAGGKGGVGTSTAAVILAAAMARADREVLLVDAGERLGTLDVLLGVTPGEPMSALRGGRVEPEQVLVPVAPGLTLLPSASSRDLALPAAERKALFSRLVSLYRRFSLVVVDAGSSAASVLDTCGHGVSRVLAVTGGDRIALAATYALIKLLHERHPTVRVDVLASRLPESIATLVHDYLNGATARFLSRTIHLAGILPDDPQFRAALSAGLDIHEAAAGSFAAQAMRSIGERLLHSDGPGDSRTPSAFPPAPSRTHDD